MRLLALLVAPLAALSLAQPASAQQGPSPSATPAQDCARGGVIRPFNAIITAQQPIEVTVLSRPGTRIELVARDPNAGARTVRTGTADDQGEARFTIRPVVNTVLSARQDPEPCQDAVFGDNSCPLNVRTALSLDAIRNGPRNYVFGGRAFPARQGQQLSLYRRTSDGREVLTATTTVTSRGTWRIDRHFTGTGRFDFVARTRADNLNTAGQSNVRPTLIF